MIQDVLTKHIFGRMQEKDIFIQYFPLHFQCTWTWDYSMRIVLKINWQKELFIWYLCGYLRNMHNNNWTKFEVKDGNEYSRNNFINIHVYYHNLFWILNTFNSIQILILHRDWLMILILTYHMFVFYKYIW